MKVFTLFLCIPFLLLGGIVDENRCKYTLSACAIFQNESLYLKEWIEYHRIVGIEHFYLYNNNSRDDYISVLAPYIQTGVVELTDWPSPPEESWIPYQELAYNDCIKQCVGETKWLAVIDIDEFIVPVSMPNLQALLNEFDSKEVGGVIMHWQFFGTSGCAKLDPTRPMVEQLVWKAPVEHSWNHMAKSICKPHKVAHYAVHGATYKRGYHDVATNRKSMPHYFPDMPVQIEHVQLNHYWTRDGEYFYNNKIPRRERFEGRSYTTEETEFFIREFNQVLDTKIFRFLPELRKRLIMN